MFLIRFATVWSTTVAEGMLPLEIQEFQLWLIRVTQNYIHDYWDWSHLKRYSHWLPASHSWELIFPSKILMAHVCMFERFVEITQSQANWKKREYGLTQDGYTSCTLVVHSRCLRVEEKRSTKIPWEYRGTQEVCGLVSNSQIFSIALISFFFWESFGGYRGKSETVQGRVVLWVSWGFNFWS